MYPQVPYYLAIAFLIVFFGVERFVRKGDQARSLEAGTNDRGSTRFILWMFRVALVSMALAPLLNLGELLVLPAPHWLGWLGVGFMAAGVGLRFWAARTLGAFYTRTLRILDEHAIVEAGPYGLVRHPGYAGVLLMWLGAGLASGNLVSLGVIVGGMSPAYVWRMRVEEKMLVEKFGQSYRDYRAGTWRVLPWVY